MPNFYLHRRRRPGARGSSNAASAEPPSPCPPGGFVVRLSHRRKRIHEYLARADFAVAELSPAIADAWQFPTREMAIRALRAALGTNVKAFQFQVVLFDPTNPPEPENRQATTTIAGSNALTPLI